MLTGSKRQRAVHTFSGAATAACAKRDEGPVPGYCFSPHTLDVHCDVEHNRTAVPAAATGRLRKRDLVGAGWSACTRGWLPGQACSRRWRCKYSHKLHSGSVLHHVSATDLSQVDGCSSEHRSGVRAAAGRTGHTSGAQHLSGRRNGQAGSSRCSCQGFLTAIRPTTGGNCLAHL